MSTDNEFSLSFDMGNSAFDNGEAAHEAARILRETAMDLESGCTSGTIWDRNGNRIGRWDMRREGE